MTIDKSQGQTEKTREQERTRESKKDEATSRTAKIGAK